MSHPFYHSPNPVCLTFSRLSPYYAQTVRDLSPLDLDKRIYQAIERLINTIGPPRVALDGCHTPTLYSRFLRSLLAKYMRQGAAMARPPTQQPKTIQSPQYTSSHVVSDSSNHHHTIRPLNSFATGVNIAGTLTFAQLVPRTEVLWLSELMAFLGVQVEAERLNYVLARTVGFIFNIVNGVLYVGADRFAVLLYRALFAVAP